MIFVYLRDGRRVDMPEAVSVIQRGLVMFLDREDQIIRQMTPEEIIAYSHVPYEEDDAPSVTEMTGLNREPPPTPPESDALLLRRRRHRSSPRHSAS